MVPSHLSGEIPSQLGYFMKLILTNNNMTEVIPQSLCNNTYVESIIELCCYGSSKVCMYPCLFF